MFIVGSKRLAACPCVMSIGSRTAPPTWMGSVHRYSRSHANGKAQRSKHMSMLGSKNAVQLKWDQEMQRAIFPSVLHWHVL